MNIILALGVSAIILFFLLIFGRPKGDSPPKEKERKKKKGTVSTLIQIIVGFVLVLIGGALSAVFGGGK